MSDLKITGDVPGWVEPTAQVLDDNLKPYPVLRKAVMIGIICAFVGWYAGPALLATSLFGITASAGICAAVAGLATCAVYFTYNKLSQLYADPKPAPQKAKVQTPAHPRSQQVTESAMGHMNALTESKTTNFAQTIAAQQMENANRLRTMS